MAAFEYEVRLWSTEDDRPVFPRQGYSARGVESTSAFADSLLEASEAIDLRLNTVHTEGGAGLLEIIGGAAPAQQAGDAYAAHPEDCPPLPTSLESAIDAFSGDARAQELLGKPFSKYFLATRAWELRAWQRSVTEWELERYRQVT